MPEHFQKPWVKWDYVEDIVDMLTFEPDKNQDELRIGLYKMNLRQLALLYFYLKRKSD